MLFLYTLNNIHACILFNVYNILFNVYNILFDVYLRYGSTTTRGTDGGRNPGVRYFAGVPSLLVARRRRTITRVDTPTTADHVRPHTIVSASCTSDMIYTR